MSNSEKTTDSAAGADSLNRIVRGFCQVAMPHPVPPEIAVCPECGGELMWQVTTADGLEDMCLDCENEPDIDDEDAEPHRGYQSDWQPVIDRVKAWILSANV